MLVVLKQNNDYIPNNISAKNLHNYMTKKNDMNITVNYHITLNTATTF